MKSYCRPGLSAIVFAGLFLIFLLGAVTAAEQWVAEYRVLPSDKLQKIAERYLGDSERYHEIASANNLRPPYVLSPGMRILIPGLAVKGAPVKEEVKEIQKTHLVGKRDTLESIARQYLGSSDLYPLIASANSMKPPFVLTPGQKIMIPRVGRAGTEVPKPILSAENQDRPAASTEEKPAPQVIPDSSPETPAVASSTVRNEDPEQSLEDFSGQKANWTLYLDYAGFLAGVLGGVVADLEREADQYAAARLANSEKELSEAPSGDSSEPVVSQGPQDGNETSTDIAPPMDTQQSAQVPAVVDSAAVAQVSSLTTEIGVSAEASTALPGTTLESVQTMTTEALAAGVTSETKNLPGKRKKVRTLITILLLLVLMYWIIRLYDAHMTEKRRGRLNRF